jgi:hypothetical protein
MNALIYQGYVMQLEEVPFAVHPNYQWVSCDNTVQVGYSYSNGVFSAPPVPVPTQEEILASYQTAIQAALDSKAREKMYNDSISIATYINSTNASWKAEATAFLAWRDAVYVYAVNILTQVQNGGAQPALSDFIAALPVMTWPD